MFAHTGRGVKCGEHEGLVCSLLNAPLLRILKGESEPFNVPERASWCTVGQLKVYRALNLREYIQVLGFARVGATFKFSSMRIKKKHISQRRHRALATFGESLTTDCSNTRVTKMSYLLRNAAMNMEADPERVKMAEIQFDAMNTTFNT